MERNWVSALKEAADKRGRRVRYAMVDCTGPGERPTFHYAAVLEPRDENQPSLVARGAGSRKSQAKAEAAKLLMEQLPEGRSARASDRPPYAISETVAHPGESDNYVTELQELCQKHKWSLPGYVERTLAPGQFLFRCSAVAVVGESDVTVTVVAAGTGSSKKTAKAAAAKDCLSVLTQLAKERCGDCGSGGGCEEAGERNDRAPWWGHV